MPELPTIRLTNQPRFRAGQVAYTTLVASVALSLVSIAASQIMLAVALAAVIWMARVEGMRISWRPVFLPLLLFFAWTVAAALASADVWLGLGIVKKFWLFLLIPIVPPLLQRARRTADAYAAIIAVALFSSAAGLVQFVENPHRDLLHRISGFMSHWMTYSGLLMLVLVALVAYGFTQGWRKNLWAVPSLALLAVPISLSQTRSAMLGAIAGIVTLLILLGRARAIAGLAVLVVAAYIAAPASFRERVRSGWDPHDPNTRNRIELFQTSIRLIRDNPVFGVGPKNVQVEAPRYRVNREFPDWLYQHMHNNFLQIAAERGLPGLALWLWLMAHFAVDSLSVFRKSTGGAEARLAAAAALGSWVALLFSGLVEYNFGDSEVLTLFLFMQSAPYAFAEMRPDRLRAAGTQPGSGARLKIAILGTRGIPANYGGFETFAEECGAGLAARGHDVTVYCRSHYVSRELRRHRGVSLVVLPTLRGKYTDTVVHTFLSVVHALFRRYDAILLCNAANGIFAWIPRLAGTPVALNVDGIERLRRKWNVLGRAYYRMSERLSVWLPNAIVTDARVIQRYYRERYGADSEFIAYGSLIGETATLDCLDRLGLSPGNYFLYVSRLEPENNAHVVVTAFRSVRTTMPLVIVGDAPYSKEYIEALKAAADSRVIFPGAIYGTGYRELLAHAFCYVHATEVGGTHPALIEAMGQGNLVVANRTPENEEALGEAGLLFDRNSTEDLAARLQGIADDPGRYAPMRELARQRARSEYCWEAVVSRYEQLLLRLAFRGRHAAAAGR